LFDNKSMKLMKEMTEAFGPSGFEREVNSLFKKYLVSYVDEVITDKLGSVGFVAKGNSDRPRVLITGHTDEVGFIVSSVTEEGYLTFNQLGGWFDQVLLGQRVVIRGSKGMSTALLPRSPLTSSRRRKGRRLSRKRTCSSTLAQRVRRRLRRSGS